MALVVGDDFSVVLTVVVAVDDWVDDTELVAVVVAVVRQSTLSTYARTSFRRFSFMCSTALLLPLHCSCGGEALCELP